jgi:DNA-binding CsgD family transcriptional regulator
MAWQRDAGMDHHMAASVPLAGDIRAGLSIHRSVADGYTPAAEHRKLRAILPQVSQAMRLGFVHNKMLEDAFWDGITIGKADQIALLLDERGRVVRYTDAAGRFISKRDGLDISRSRLRALRPGQDAALQAMIKQAIETVSPRSGAGRITRPSGRVALIVVCYPLPRSRRMLAPAEAAALVTVVDPSIHRRSPPDLYRQAFGLTVREAELAALLLSGHSVDSAAALMEMAMPTARTHMRHLFEKTATPGQGALIRLLTQIA